MKRYYEFFASTDGEGKEYFTVDVTQVSFLRHNESKGAHGETTISWGVYSCNFSGCGNKTVYDEIRKIMSELETTNE